jgi:hypothetical protein
VLPEVDRAVRQTAADLGRSESWIYEMAVIQVLGDKLPPQVAELSRLWNGDT